MPGQLQQTRGRIFVALLLAAAVLQPARAAKPVWAGGQGNSSDGSKWSTGQVPGQSDTAHIDNGKVTVTGNLTLGLLELSSDPIAGTTGTLAGSGTLNLSLSSTLGRSQWDAGEMSFSGGGGVTISNSSALDIRTGNDHRLNSTAITNNGAIAWTGGTLSTGGGSSIVNASGATFTTDQDGSMLHNLNGNRAVFSNAGTFRKSGGTATTLLEATFDNTGTLDITSGTVRLAGGGTSTGSVTFANGGRLELNGSDYAFTGGTLSGNGTIEVSANTATFGGTTGSANMKVSGTGTAHFTGNHNTSGALTLVAGNVEGTSTETATIGGGLTWTGGTITAARVQSTGGGTIGAGGSKILGNGAQLSLAGSTTWTGDTVTTGGGSAITNSGTFDVTTDSALAHDTTSGARSSFRNDGTFTKSSGAGGSAKTEVQTVFTNNGTVNANAGTLLLSGGGSNTGTLSTGNGARLELGSGFSLTGGTVNGSGTTAIVGTTTWSGGTMNGTGTTSVETGGTLTVSGSGDKVFGRGDGTTTGGRVIDNSGRITWSAGALRGGDGAQIVNRSNAVFDAAGDGNLTNSGSGAQPSFDNRGSFVKSASAGGSTVVSGMTFVSSGSVAVQQGTLRFDSSVTSNGGSFFADSGTTLVFAGGQRFNNGSVIHGTGLVRAIADVTTFDGTIAFDTFELAGGGLYGASTVDSGTLRWTGGELRDSATLTLNSAAVLEISGTGNRDFMRGDGTTSGGRVINNRGQIIWSNDGDLRGGDGAQIVNNAGALFEVRNDRTLAHTGSGDVATFTNHGVFLKSAGNNTTTVAIPFANSATGFIAVQHGTLRFTSTFTNANGSVGLEHGATLSVSSTLNLGTGALFGTGTIEAKQVIAGGVVSPGSSPGTLAITGDLSLLTTSSLLIELGGATQGTSYDFLNVSGSAGLGGTLVVSFVNGYQTTMPSTATFTIITAANGLTGAFANVANGARVFTSDGIGSFQVNYGAGSSFAANSVVLSNFVAVPEPSTWVLMSAGTALTLLGWRRRRKA
jgi:hypothetical protein